MSYITGPRIGFIATDAMTNPSTANNENLIHLLDIANVAYLNPPAVNTAALPVLDDAVLPVLDDVAYREWMTSQLTFAQPVDDKEQPEWQFGMPGYLNYYGDHLTTFGTAQVNGVWLDEGSSAPMTGDALVGARVAFDAKLVDLNPADTFTSQLISIAFRLFGAGKDGETIELISGLPTNSRTRWLNFNRYQGAATFQSVIPNDAVTFADADAAPASPGLDALRQGAAQGGGLLLRYCIYGLQAGRTMDEMYDRFHAGDEASNPKIGRVLGTIGVWNGADMKSVPIGRLLHPHGSPFHAGPEARPTIASAAIRVKSHEDVDRVTRQHASSMVAAAAIDWSQRMGPAVAVVAGEHVWLDLLTTFPENGDPGPTGIEKHDFGPVTLELEQADGKRISLGPVVYDRATYEAQAGIVVITVPPAARPGLTDGTLLLMAGAEPLVREIDVVQVETDDHSVYMDLQAEGAAPSATADIELRAFRKGEPITEPVVVGLQYFADAVEPGELNSLNPLVVTACKTTNTHIGAIGSLAIPAGGRAALTLAADEPGCFKVRLLPPSLQPNDDPDFTVEFFTNYRVLPVDDYTHISDADLTWDVLYREVISYYAIMYPVMAEIIPWGPTSTPTDPERVVQFASLMREAIDESRIGTALQMPITRELSRGKRRLIQRWCDLQLK